METNQKEQVIGYLLTHSSSSNDDNEDSSSTTNIKCLTEGHNGTRLSVATVTLPDGSTALIQEGQTVQLDDGTTAFVQAVTEKADVSGNAKFIDGQAVQLEDGTTAFIHTAPKGLQAVQLEDGTTAYIAHSAEGLFDGDTAGLSLDNFGSDGDKDEMSRIQPIGVPTRISSARALALGEKAFRCLFENCGRLYTTQHHLKVHERSHTGDRPFKCDAIGCGKAFATGYGLKSHTRVHTGEKPYKCPDDTCDKAFKTSGDLQKHVRTHTGERPFKCPFEGCDRAFTTSNIRKVHIRTHTGERPYLCNEDGCGRSFASATNYKNHIRIHTGEKPYVCTVQGCGKRFTEYSSLYKHHVVHTHSKPYICNYCGKNYRQTSTLAMHKRTSHGVLDPVEEADLINATEQGITFKFKVEDDEELMEAIPKRQCIKISEEGSDSITNLVIQGSGQVSGAMTLQVTTQTQDSTSSPQILVVADPSHLVTLQEQLNLSEPLITASVAKTSQEETAFESPAD
uniref:C2H2-type domain-containing protein n=1 Tax=Strigamia maritima TaxID=126957 RepID=T1JP83_STRMM